MAKKLPPLSFAVLVDGKPVEMAGFSSTPALAIVQDGKTFASVMLMNGAVLAQRFESITEAHSFNLAVASDKRLRPGTADLHEFYASGGGVAATKLALEKLRKKVSKEQTK